MTSFYTVVQYVPDPVADERINVGVLVLTDGMIRGEFTKNWKRLQTFSGEDVEFLRDFAGRVASWTPDEPSIPGLEEVMPLGEEGFRKIAGDWMNSIRFTDVRASTLSEEQLLDQMSSRYLRKPPRRKRTFRDRRHAVKAAWTNLESAFAQVSGEAGKDLVRRNVTLSGSLDSHKFDVGIQNGQVYLGVAALSFEGPARHDLDKEIDATAWALSDVREALPDMKLGVVTLPPKTHASRSYERAQGIFEGLRTSFVEEDQIASWAHEVAEDLKEVAS